MLCIPPAVANGMSLRVSCIAVAPSVERNELLPKRLACCPSRPLVPKLTTSAPYESRRSDPNECGIGKPNSTEPPVRRLRPRSATVYRAWDRYADTVPDTRVWWSDGSVYDKLKSLT